MRQGIGVRSVLLAISLLLVFSIAPEARSASAVPDGAAEPPLETDQAALDEALTCIPFMHPDKPPVLLLPATFVTGAEQYNWSYLPLLADRGFDVCVLTYPDRGLGDQQVTAEYIVNALRRIYAETGRKVAMIGHSQGASMPRWALKWWPSARDAVADYVSLAGLNHGSMVFDAVGLAASNPAGWPAALWQFKTDSRFVAALNRGDETPGDIAYTTIYTLFDEFVQPVVPTPSAALDFGQDNPLVANLLLQDVCPGRFVDHMTIATTDRLAFELALDAIRNPGPANVERVDGAAICRPSPLVPDQIFAAGAVKAMLATLASEPANRFPHPHLVTEEPALKAYV